MHALVLISTAASLLFMAVILWLQQPKESTPSPREDQFVVRYSSCSIAPLERIPKRFTPRFLSSLYLRFPERDADRIVEEQKDKLMTVTAKVVQVSERYLCLESKSLWRHVVLVRGYFPVGKPDPVTALLTGKTVKVRGQLLSAYRYDITRFDVELLKAPKL